MNWFVVFLGLGVLLSLVVGGGHSKAGAKKFKPKKKVAGVTAAQESFYKNLAYLLVKVNSTFSYTCSGVFVSVNRSNCAKVYFTTAAHCLIEETFTIGNHENRKKNPQRLMYKVTSGHVDITFERVMSMAIEFDNNTVWSSAAHYDATATSVKLCESADVSFFEIPNSMIRAIHPISSDRIVTVSNGQGNDCYAVGFGLNVDKPAQMVKISTFAKDCQINCSSSLDADTFCGTSKNTTDSTGIEEGDSGGPVMCKLAGEWKLAALVSSTSFSFYDDGTVDTTGKMFRGPSGKTIAKMIDEVYSYGSCGKSSRKRQIRDKKKMGKKQ